MTGRVRLTEGQTSAAGQMDGTLAQWRSTYNALSICGIECLGSGQRSALGYLTPNQFYAKWVSEQPSATSPVSDMP